jgi:hypothetical protein
MAHLRSALGALPCTPARHGPAKPALRLPLAASLMLCLCTGGCAGIEPWVKPYEREKLADPIMQWSRGALADKHREHVHLVREGARGATGVQGGGCGCN